jgi:hypothetical protein
VALSGSAGITDPGLRLVGDVKGKRVLDLGCGTGDAAITFAKRGAVVIAVDPSVERLGRARERAGLDPVAADHGVAQPEPPGRPAGDGARGHVEPLGPPAKAEQPQRDDERRTPPSVDEVGVVEVGVDERRAQPRQRPSGEHPERVRRRHLDERRAARQPQPRRPVEREPRRAGR